MFMCLDHGDGYNGPYSTSHCSNHKCEVFQEPWGRLQTLALQVSYGPVFYQEQLPVHWSSEMAFP